jgi:hypothetical protein
MCLAAIIYFMNGRHYDGIRLQIELRKLAGSEGKESKTLEKYLRWAQEKSLLNRVQKNRSPKRPYFSWGIYWLAAIGVGVAVILSIYWGRSS